MRSRSIIKSTSEESPNFPRNLKYFQTLMKALNQLEDESKRTEFFNREIDGKNILDVAIETGNYSLARLFIGNRAKVNNSTERSVTTKPSLLYKALEKDIDHDFVKFLVKKGSTLTDEERIAIEQKLPTLQLDDKNQIQFALDIIDKKEEISSEDNAFILIKKLSSAEQSEREEIKTKLTNLFKDNASKAFDKRTSKVKGKTDGRTALHLVAQSLELNDILTLMLINIAQHNKNNPTDQLSIDQIVDIKEDRKINYSERESIEGKEGLLVQGVTPLDLAIRAGNKDAVKILVNQGANINARMIRSNQETYTIFDIAMRGTPDLEILKILSGDNKTKIKAELPINNLDKIVKKLSKPENQKICDLLKERYPEIKLAFTSQPETSPQPRGETTQVAAASNQANII